MAESLIEWTDYTFNCWEGCVKVSPGCKFCYAERRDKRLYGGEHWGPGSPRFEHGEAYWRQLLTWQRKAVTGGYYARVFCGSLCDILEGAYHGLDDLRARYFAMVPQTPNLIHLFLTKRPENAFAMFPDEWRSAWPANAMLGFTGENQKWYQWRKLDYWRTFARRVKGLRTFVSCEPLLGPIDLDLDDGARIDWVIAGGESGSGARPMHPDWVRSLRDQCAAAGVPFLFKQWGEWTPGENVDRQSGIVQTAELLGNEWLFSSESLAREAGHVDDEPDLYRLGKKAAGRVLDGVEHNGLPDYWPTPMGLPCSLLKVLA